MTFRRSLSRLSRPALVFLLPLATACTHHQGAFPVGAGHVSAIRGDLAIAGVMVRSASGAWEERASSAIVDRLAREAGAENASGSLSVEETAVLLGDPLQLQLRARDLREIRTRIGHRYVLVGAQGGASVLHDLYWDVAIAVPILYTIIFFDIPVNVKTTPDVPRALRLLRVVDLEQATIVAESSEVFRSRPDDDGFDRGQIRHALKEMNLRGK